MATLSYNNNNKKKTENLYRAGEMVQRIKELTALADRWPEVGSHHQNEMAYNLVTSALTCAQIHIDI